MERASKHGIDLWIRYYRSLAESYLFPNEFVVRSFLGGYPNLRMSRNYRGAKACDVSCGDGRNIVLLHKLGLQLYATEVSEEICEITRQKLLSHSEKISADIRKGRNRSLPFEDDYFDYVLSWNACYYMEDETSDISDHIKEYSRILKKGGYLVASVPSPDCFTLEGAEKLGNNLIRINTNSKWDILNGSIYYQFKSFDHVVEKFGEEFTDFQKATISDDCFGITLAYFIFVCRKR
jgi:ubiquinone/menaquinone biosynthesis C-methylase UbiE